jgi:hypothetical protein
VIARQGAMKNRGMKHGFDESTIFGDMRFGSAEI